ncbi:Alpha-glucosidase [Diaporthe amygdali]|uniref:Alpha-glucosidase n=1 Tax=Phomopsis amygdali TaxID=1214568 RepID=UPI0022FE43EA|nr:Alpha-glucosidase [Diaporthe amygdali]KAJ0122509.1 Alpha-glucosidase [Diaporthe amygdali]
MSGEIPNGTFTPGGVAALFRPNTRLESSLIYKVFDPSLVFTFSFWITLRLALPRKFTNQTETTTSYREVFTVPADSDVGQPILPNVEDPQAVDAQSVCPGYTASNLQNTTTGFTADLSLGGDACNVYGNEIEQLILTVEYQASDRLHVGIQPRYIGPENETWFLLPEAIVPKPAISSDGDTSSDSSDFELSWTNDPTFSFTVRRKSSGDTLFTTEGSKLVYEDQFIEFVSPLPENYNLYGLGEVMHGFRLGNNLTRTFFAADVGNPIDENIYGVHPVYLDTRYFQDGTYVANATDTSTTYTTSSHGVFQRNAHPQEVLLRPEGITWRALGGTIDLYFYSGPSAADVVKSYHASTVGLPAMQQYWTFGYHQCRWGYENWTKLQEVVDNFAASDIPLETIWTDIDYMNQYRDFDNDQKRFGYEEGTQFLAKLHANGQHYVPIVDSAIYHPNPDNESDAYAPYDRGVEAGAFMMNPDESLYIGTVWPGYTVFPDWVGDSLGATNGSGAFSWWRNEITSWYQNVSFDGIWIDMSEVSSFCVGSCGSANVSLNPVHPPFLLPGEPGNEVLGYPEGFNLTNATEAASASSASASQASATASSSASSTTTSYLRTTPTPGARNVNYPPYSINHVSGDLAVHAVSPNATHHDGSQEYDFHNLFGHQILNATYHGLLATLPTKRPFIIGRATFAGSGKWAGHWGGDNYSVWSSMVLAISQALSFSIFGIPMFGPDVCGFSGNSDLELCNRWMQVGAFFPFYRNHNTLGANSQEPYVWASVAEASRTAMAIRYTLLPYMYTLFAHAHSNGTTVLRALVWEFPEEPWLANADHQFLLGGSVLVTPVLTQGAESVDGVFPGSGDGTTVWYDWYNQTAITGVSRGQNVTIDAPLGHIPVYIRGGSVIPTQKPGKTTAESRQNPWGLLVALDLQGAAEGTLYLDDGESLVPNATTWVQLSASNTSVTAQPTGNYKDSVALANVTVLGVTGQVSNVTLNGQAVTSGWSWDSATNILSITGLENSTSDGAWNSKWELQWSLSNNGSGVSNSNTGSSRGAEGDGQSPASGGSGYVIVPLASMVAMLVGALAIL